MQEENFDFLKKFHKVKPGAQGRSGVAVFFPLPQEEAYGDQQGQGLGHHDGHPDAVHLQDQGQEHHGGHLEQQGAQEGDAGGHRAVAQGGEEGGAEDVEAHQQEGQGV